MVKQKLQDATGPVNLICPKSRDLTHRMLAFHVNITTRDEMRIDNCKRRCQSAIWNLVRITLRERG
jgi:hypothetical protein